MFLQIIVINAGITDANIHAEMDSMQLTSLRELEMLRFMNTITDKSGWEAKV